MVTSRRSSIDIIAEILRLGEANKTKIMYQVNMSHTQMQSYLQYLTERSFLERHRNGKGQLVYGPTDAGLALLEHIAMVQRVVGGLDSLAAAP